MGLIHSFIDFGTFLAIDNITKLFITYSRVENRYSILLYECLLLGFISTFMFAYHHIPYVLILLVFIQSIGSILSEIPLRDINKKLENILHDCLEVVKFLFEKLWLSLRNRVSKDTFIVKPMKQFIPNEWKYNYPLKPIEDLRSEPTSVSPISTRSGIVNLNGRTSGLNSLLQCLASSSVLCDALKTRLKFSQQAEHPTVIQFFDLLIRIHNHQKSVDPSSFVSTLAPDFVRLLPNMNVDDLFQQIIHVLNDSLAKQYESYSNNVTQQIYCRKLLTASPFQLKNLLDEFNNELHQNLMLTTIDEKTYEIVNYADASWLLYHAQRSSTVKQIASGQLLYAYFTENTKQVTFHNEPFEILKLPIDKNDRSLDQVFRKFTQVGIIDEGRNSSQIKSISGRQNKIQKMISHFPDLLCVRLQRPNKSVVSTLIPISIDPEKVYDLSRLHYSTWLGISEEFSHILAKYRLLAVVLRLSYKGSTNFHYVSLYRGKQNRWFLADDERIVEIHQTRNFFQDSYVTENVHLVFLERDF